MRKIMACLDVGTDTVKLVVGEIVKKKLNILAVAEAEGKGVKDGLVEDANALMTPLKSVIAKCEEVIGLPIHQMIVSVPAMNASYSVVMGNININNEGNLIDGKDVIHVIQKAVKSVRSEDLEYISMIPTSFALDDNRVVKDPKGLTSRTMSVRGVMVRTPKKNIYPILACLEKLGIDVVDIALSSLGDYYEYKTKELDKEVGAVINLGDETTTIAIFNKGVLTNSKVLNLGGQNIDNDISFIYKVPLNTAKDLKENFALAHKNMAQTSDVITVEDKSSRVISLNQLEVSEVTMSRLLEILNITKKEINSLTKKEISYIIFTGGLTEFKDFPLALQDVYGNNAIIGKNMEIGVRNNKYSSCLGLLKYYSYNAKLKDKDYSMFTIEEQQELSGTILAEENESIMGKLFGYIFNG